MMGGQVSSKRRTEEGFGGLFDFGFQKWTTPWAVRVVYAVGFALVAMVAIVQVVTIIAMFGSLDQATVTATFGEASVRSRPADTVRAMLLLELIAVPFAALLALTLLRLVLEFFLGSYLLGQPDEAEPASTPVQDPEAPMPQGSWQCRCGHMNEEGASLCVACGRSPRAII